MEVLSNSKIYKFNKTIVVHGGTGQSYIYISLDNGKNWRLLTDVYAPPFSGKVIHLKDNFPDRIKDVIITNQNIYIFDQITKNTDYSYQFN